MENKQTVKAIIGLGNPGHDRYYNRHSIGFRILDALADRYGAAWSMKDEMAMTTIQVDGAPIFLIKPQTYMNASGRVFPKLAKKGIKAEDILVIHDELEFPFGKIAYRIGGSARGHNGLRSLIAACGPDFGRLRVGIDRPAEREQVPDYVLQNFRESSADVDAMIESAVDYIERLIKG